MEIESSTERKIFGKLHMLSEVSIYTIYILYLFILYRTGHTVYLTHTWQYFRSVFLGIESIKYKE